MKTLLNTIIVLLLTGTSLTAQFGPLSPRSNVRQQLGHGYVTIETTRPMARGRKIFGGLVPYDELWQTGASGTYITFDEDVKIAGQYAPASRYALTVVPGKKEWTIRLSRNSVMPNSPDYDYGKEISVCVPVTQPGRFYEAWSVDLDLTPGNAQLYFSWTDVQVSIPIETSSEQQAMAYVDSLASAPLTADADAYYSAARYLRFNKQLPETIIVFARHLITLEGKERYYPFELMADAYQMLGDKEKALAALEKGLEILPREFFGETEVIEMVTESFERRRAELKEME